MSRPVQPAVCHLLHRQVPAGVDLVTHLVNCAAVESPDKSRTCRPPGSRPPFFLDRVSTSSRSRIVPKQHGSLRRGHMARGGDDARATAAPVLPDCGRSDTRPGRQHTHGQDPPSHASPPTIRPSKNARRPQCRAGIPLQGTWILQHPLRHQLHGTGNPRTYTNLLFAPFRLFDPDPGSITGSGRKASASSSFLPIFSRPEARSFIRPRYAPQSCRMQFTDVPAAPSPLPSGRRWIRSLRAARRRGIASSDEQSRSGRHHAAFGFVPATCPTASRRPGCWPRLRSGFFSPRRRYIQDWLRGIWLRSGNLAHSFHKAGGWRRLRSGFSSPWRRYIQDWLRGIWLRSGNLAHSFHKAGGWRRRLLLATVPLRPRLASRHLASFGQPIPQLQKGWRLVSAPTRLRRYVQDWLRGIWLRSGNLAHSFHKAGGWRPSGPASPRHGAATSKTGFAAFGFVRATLPTASTRPAASPRHGAVTSKIGFATFGFVRATYPPPASARVVHRARTRREDANYVANKTLINT